MEYFSIDYVEEKTQKPVTGVVHIGAHYGEEASEYSGRNLKVLWFEAHPHYAQTLKTRLIHYPNQQGFELLLSDVDREIVDFWITKDEYASSMLKPKYHQVQNPHAPISGKIQLWTTRFDTWANNHVEVQTSLQELNLLVLDVQGAELKVWNGMGKYQSGFDAIISEYSTVEFYENVPRIEDLDTAYHGFKRVDPAPGTEAIHGDALYIRSE